MKIKHNNLLNIEEEKYTVITDLLEHLKTFVYLPKFDKDILIKLQKFDDVQKKLKCDKIVLNLSCSFKDIILDSNITCISDIKFRIVKSLLILNSERNEKLIDISAIRDEIQFTLVRHINPYNLNKVVANLNEVIFILAELAQNFAGIGTEDREE